MTFFGGGGAAQIVFNYLLVIIYGKRDGQWRFQKFSKEKGLGFEFILKKQK